MGDQLVFTTVDFGQGDVSAACIALACPRCGCTVKPIARDDPRGYSARERRLVVRCAAPIGCKWEGVLVVELVDLQSRNRRLRRAG